MDERAASAVIIGRTPTSWDLLLYSASTRGLPEHQNPTWTLPTAELLPGQSSDAVVARLVSTMSGYRILPAEFLNLGWYSLSQTHNTQTTLSAYITIIPDTNAITTGNGTKWWPLRALTSMHPATTLDTTSTLVIRDAAKLTPSDALHHPIVVPAADKHSASMLSLLHSVRERTGGVTPKTWDLELLDVETSHRADGGDFLVAALDNFVVAMVGIRAGSTPHCELGWLMVHPRWRGRGLAKHMVQKAEQRALELGFTNIAVNNARLHGVSQHVFSTLGYSNPPTTGTSMPSVVVMKELTPAHHTV